MLAAISSGRLSSLLENLERLFGAVSDFVSEFKKNEVGIIQLRTQLKTLIQDGRSLVMYSTDATAKSQLIDSVITLKSMVEELLGISQQTREGMEHVERLLRRMAQLDRVQFEPTVSNSSQPEQYWREKYVHTQQKYDTMKHYVDELLVDLQYITRSKTLSRTNSSFRLHNDTNQGADDLTFDMDDTPKISSKEVITLPSIIKDTKTQFVVEKEVTKFSNQYSLNIVEDIYKRDFFEKIDHSCYVCYSSKQDPSIIAVSNVTTSDVWWCLEITKKGYSHFSVPANKKVSSKAQIKALEAVKSPGCTFMLIREQLHESVLSIEVNSPQTKSEMTIAVIFCKTGQNNPHEMMCNKPTEPFIKFLKDMNIHPTDKNANRTKSWQALTITYFVATQLDKDEHRRDVGNSPAMIFFKEEGEQFDASEIHTLGMVPQIFVVVQPYKKDYRIGFFNSGNMQPYRPPLPANFTFAPKEIQEFILTKIHNGYINFFYASPMNRSFMLKRQEEIAKIAEATKKK
eukprot:TRINITY_DN9293_c0_g1_i3.p1 TRINITY_DN9293_c0_g1~~TRINITY_DN9293_c0_g1_i3.p1  ORF type:complete len:514 (+),score=89.49 TRINITY_DN9293_c0_g1_i3:345-1886(+)